MYSAPRSEELSVKRTSPIPQLVRFHAALQRHRFATLLASLVLLLIAIAVVYLFPDPHERILTGLSIALLFDLMLLSAVNAVCQTRKTMIVAISVAVPTAIFSVMSILVRSAITNETVYVIVYAINNLLAVVFVTLVIILVLDFLFRTRRVDANMICASLCVYFLMGIVWASLYSLCEVFQPESFIYAYTDEFERVNMVFGGEKSLVPIYYSFVTLTTLGYGDIVPASPPAKILAILEAVVGQIYLTVLVARLVGLHIAHVTSPPTD